MGDPGSFLGGHAVRLAAQDTDKVKSAPYKDRVQRECSRERWSARKRALTIAKRFMTN